MKRLKPVLLLLALALVASIGRPAEAAGTRKFCLNWQYQLTDQGLGEDYLLHTGGIWYGTIDAMHAYATVSLNSQQIWAGWMDSSGCTPAVSGNSGTFSVYLYSDIYRSTDNVHVLVMDNDSDWDTWIWGYQTTLAAVPNGQTTIHDKNLGGGESIANASAIWTRHLALSGDGRVTGGKIYSVVTLENCPGLGTSACYDPNVDALYLGSDAQGNKSKRKFLVAYEIGHNLQYWLFGTQNHPYTQDAPDTANPDYCRCDHIPDAALRGHCLQSREHSGAGQTEGFGHFNAADVFNSPADATAVFGYYKHFLYAGQSGSGTAPPTAWNAFQNAAPYRWKDTHCPASGSNGVELDWMTFYYEVHNKTTTKYSFNDLRSVYLQACGGSACNGDNVVWSTLSTAVPAVFGVGTAKSQYWLDQGNEHGVDD